MADKRGDRRSSNAGSDPTIEQAQKLILAVQDAAEDRTQGSAVYSNNVRFAVSPNEVTLDFYLLTPPLKQSEKQPRGQRVARLMLPIAVAYEIAHLIQTNIEQAQEQLGFSIVSTNEVDHSEQGTQDE